MQWCLLKEEDVIPRIRAMEGRRGRPPNPDRPRAREESRMKRRKGRPPNVGSAEFLDNTDAKLLRKLQAQGKTHLLSATSDLTKAQESTFLSFWLGSDWHRSQMSSSQMHNQISRAVLTDPSPVCYSCTLEICPGRGQPALGTCPQVVPTGFSFPQLPIPWSAHGNNSKICGSVGQFSEYPSYGN